MAAIDDASFVEEVAFGNGSALTGGPGHDDPGHDNLVHGVDIELEHALAVDFASSLSTSFIDSDHESDPRWRASLVANSPVAGTDLLSVLRAQFRDCESFSLCVAFVSDEALQTLVQVLSELAGHGVRGRFLTSSYQNFNSPAALRKLLGYENLDVRVYQGPMHAKGYIFDHRGYSTLIIGSSNLTASALTCNREWNVVMHSFGKGEMLERVMTEFSELWGSSSTVRLSEGWIDAYAAYRSSEGPARQRRKTFVADAGEQALSDERGRRSIVPNAMQRDALVALERLHEAHEPRALLVSATGTGKTYLSAFDVAAVKPARVLFLAHRRRILKASMKSYRTLLGDRFTYAVYRPGASTNQATCLFAMASTIVNHLDEFDPRHFDYIVIDEAHRAGATGYQRIMDHFEPGFYLGMTATPNRTDGFDVFELFNHVIAFQITLQDALANDMLCPFHYFGIADLVIDDEEQDDLSLFARLTDDARVTHVISKIEEYTIDPDHIRGLVFCGRVEEARELSRKFNERGYRTASTSGADAPAERDRLIERLESGELQYIFSVDILNEGVDIPSVNQIIMLRRTDSAIIFVQQLGRGLRKHEDKDYTLVLDFIGNYQQNFLIPVALSGDKTFDKSRLRAIVKQGSSAIPGTSTVSFDRVAESRVLAAIDKGDFLGTAFLRDKYRELKLMLGRIPELKDFDEQGAVDPLLIFRKFGSYHVFLEKYEPDYRTHFSADQCAILKFVSQRLAHGKRIEDLLVIKGLVEAADGRVAGSETGATPAAAIAACAESRYGRATAAVGWRSVAGVLDGSFDSPKGFVPLSEFDGKEFRSTARFESALADEVFRAHLAKLVDFGISRADRSYSDTYRDTPFVLYAKYSVVEVARLLEWKRKPNALNVGGYMYDKGTKTFPVFITYDKSPDIDASVKYADRFVSESEIIAASKNRRSLTSPEIVRLKEWPDNGMRIYLFMRKGKFKNDLNEYYFLGEAHPTGEFEQVVMPDSGEPVVEITYRLRDPVRHDLYDYMLSDLSGEEPA